MNVANWLSVKSKIADQVLKCYSELVINMEKTVHRFATEKSLKFPLNI